MAFGVLLLAAFWLILGPLLYFDRIETATGKPRQAPGVFVTLLGMGTGFVGLLGLLYLRARARPVVRLYREGLEINFVGGPGPSEVFWQAVPLIWVFAAIERFRVTRVRMRWEAVFDIQFSGLALLRTLTITGATEPEGPPGTAGANRAGSHPQSVYVRDADVDAPLERIAETLLYVLRVPGARSSLPSWSGDAR